MGNLPGHGIPFPRRTQLPRPAYEPSTTVFHIVLKAHPGIQPFTVEFRNAVWRDLLVRTEGSGVELYAACLMPDHLHLLIQPVELNLLDFLRRFKSQTTRLAWAHGYRGAVWQSGMWDRSMRSRRDMEATRDYIVANPSKAALVAEGDRWEWTYVPE